MDITFHHRMEEYYQRFIDLQEKLRKSEEERLKLEIKFNELLQKSREEEQAHYRKLRSQYKRFLDEDRKRQERNEKILRALERIESRVNSLMSKTERFKLLRRQYKSYLDGVTSTSKSNNYREGFHRREPSCKIPPVQNELEKCDEEKMEILDKYLRNFRSNNLESTSHISVQSSNKDKTKTLNDLSKRLCQNFDSNKANSIAEDIMNSIYNRHYKKDAGLHRTQKQVANEMGRFKASDYDSDNEDVDFRENEKIYSSRKGSIQGGKIEKQQVLLDQIPTCNVRNEKNLRILDNLDKNESSSIPHENTNLANSINDKHEKETPFRLDGTISENSSFENMPHHVSLRSEEEPESLTKSQYIREINNENQDGTPISNIKISDDLENNLKFNKDISHNIESKCPSQSLLNDKVSIIGSNQMLSEPKAAQSISDPNNKILENCVDAKENANYVESEQYYEIYKDTKKDENEYEENMESLKKRDMGQPIPEQITIDNNQQQSMQQLHEKIERNVNENPSESQHNPNDNLQQMFQQNNGNEQLILQQNGDENSQRSNVPSEQYDENVDSKQYDSNDQLIIQSQNDQSSPQQHDENNQLIHQQYEDDQAKLLQQFDENHQAVDKQFYDENGEKIIHEHFEEIGQPINHNDVYNNVPSQQEYDGNTQLIEEQYEVDGQEVNHQEYNENDQAICQEYEENGHLLYQQPYNENVESINQEYDEHGQSIHQEYDENGHSVFHQQYDENGQPINQQYDENGQPLYQHYDENSQPLYQQYDENGQAIDQAYFQQYADYGQPEIQYDANGQPLNQQQYDDSGHNIVHQQYDKNGQPIYQQYDETCYDQTQQQFDNHNNFDPVLDYKGEMPEEIKNDDIVPKEQKVDEISLSTDLKKPNYVLDLLDTDTESAKQNTSKISHDDSDFDFSNG